MITVDEMQDEIYHSARREFNNKLESLKLENEKLKKQIKKLQNKIKKLNK